MCFEQTAVSRAQFASYTCSATATVIHVFVLQEHLHDVNAFVRSKALQIWMQLCNGKVREELTLH